MTTGCTQKDEVAALLCAYAAGQLDDAFSLIVSSHIALSERARAYIRHCEALGGVMMEENCAPVAMSNSALTAVLGRLGTAAPAPVRETKAAKPHPVLPRVLCACAPLKSCGTPHWRLLYPGVRVCPLPVGAGRTRAYLVKMAPGVRVPAHDHKGPEITLVLEGGYSDETGTYRRGDLMIADAGLLHSPVADRQAGCVCMIVTAAPRVYKGRLRVVMRWIGWN